MASNHLLELQKEIKEEEDEIFGHINSLINSRSKLYFTLDENDDIEGDLQPKQQIKQVSRHYDTDQTVHSTSMLHRIFNNSHFSNTNVQDSTNSTTTTTDDHTLLYTNSCDDLNDYQSYSADDTAPIQDFKNDSDLSDDNPQELILPLPHARYEHQLTDNEAEEVGEFLSQRQNHKHHETELKKETQFFKKNSDLTDQVDSTTSNAENHNPLDKGVYIDEQYYSKCINPDADKPNFQSIHEAIQQATNSLPKPCVFFLEGNCRRSDCKYSHDLSKITCKYWIEGFCFKGELCPFLHSYSPLAQPQDTDLLDNDSLKILEGKEINPTFVIESEADFPSLPLDAPSGPLDSCLKNPEEITDTIKHQILSSNSAVLFKTIKRKRKRG